MKTRKYTGRRLVHGESNGRNGTRARLYQIWQGMKNRCSNPKAPNYKYYGLKGVKVCRGWKNSYIDFKKWALENGYKSHLVLDRLNSNKGYNSDNCQWITSGENSKKACSVNRRLTFEQATEIRKSSLSDTVLSKIYGISASCIWKIRKYKSYKKDYS